MELVPILRGQIRNYEGDSTERFLQTHYRDNVIESLSLFLSQLSS